MHCMFLFQINYFQFRCTYLYSHMQYLHIALKNKYTKNTQFQNNFNSETGLQDKVS